MSGERTAGRSRRGVAVAFALAALLLAGSCSAMRDQLLQSLLYFPSRPFAATPAEEGLAFEDVSIRTADGETLHAWWVPAKAQPSTAHALFFHGNAGNVSHRVDTLVPFVENGIDVLLVDYRGYGRSTGTPSEDGTAADSRAALGALHAQPGVDRARVIYFGESLGGAVAVELASEIPPAGLVLQSTFTGVEDMARLHYPMIPRLLVPDAYPTLTRMAALRCPLLLLHGDADDLVPLAHGRALFDAAGGPKRLEVVAGGGHNDLLWVAGPRFGRLLGEWVAALPSLTVQR